MTLVCVSSPERYNTSFSVSHEQMLNTASIIINILVIALGFIAFLTSIALLCLIFYHRRQFPINTSVFLMCNTFVPIVFVSLISIDMYVHHLCADINGNVTFDGWWCYVRAYFLHVSIALLFHSYLIQTIFRFFRVVFYRKKHLQTLRFMFRLVLVQWLIDFASLLPFLLRHRFNYILEHYFCEILFQDVLGITMMSGMTYNLPMVLMACLYSYIIYYMKKTKSQSILQNRHRSNQRDLVVLRRIMILLGILITFGVPTWVFFCECIITGYPNEIGYRVGWSLFTVSISILPTASALLTPQLYKLIRGIWKRNSRIQPTIAR